MIRFRFTEDEERYLRLLSEVYRIVGAKLPPREMTVVMRNLGKLQDILLLEGVRQGVSAAAIGVMQVEKSDLYTVALRPLQLHAYIYGSHDTPLNEVEKTWLNNMNVSEEEVLDWLDPHPMEFAPDTQEAALAEQKAPREKARTSWDDWDDDDVKQELGVEDDDDIHIDDLLSQSEEGAAFKSPQVLDRIRDVLVGMNNAGQKPDSWEQLILAVHRATHIDAGFIDLQLGTAMGRTVLAQAGMPDLQPGPMGTDLTSVFSQQEVDVTPLTAEEVAERMNGD